MAKDESQKHILVVNDTPELLQLFQELLTEEGYRVTVDRFTGDLAHIHAAIRSVKPDLVILDYVIGREGTGWQLLQMLKMDRATKDLPIVVCTAAAEQIEPIRAHLDDMRIGVVLKPFDIDDLLNEVKKALEKCQN
jgi:CheY-like chemotaxis protein